MKVILDRGRGVSIFLGSAAVSRICQQNMVHLQWDTFCILVYVVVNINIRQLNQQGKPQITTITNSTLISAHIGGT